MSTNYTTYQQHEPFRIPSNWGAQEKKFVYQLEETFDDIYKRFGRLRLEDMGAKFRKSYEQTMEDSSMPIFTSTLNTKRSSMTGSKRTFIKNLSKNISDLRIVSSTETAGILISLYLSQPASQGCRRLCKDAGF